MEMILLSLLLSTFATLKRSSLFLLFSPLAFKKGWEIHFAAVGVVVTCQRWDVFIIVKQSWHGWERHQSIISDPLRHMQFLPRAPRIFWKTSDHLKGKGVAWSSPGKTQTKISALKSHSDTRFLSACNLSEHRELRLASLICPGEVLIL